MAARFTDVVPHRTGEHVRDHGGRRCLLGNPAARLLYFDDLDDPCRQHDGKGEGFHQLVPDGILGIRTTLNGSPINYPVYLCRTRAN